MKTFQITELIKKNAYSGVLFFLRGHLNLIFPANSAAISKINIMQAIIAKKVISTTKLKSVIVKNSGIIRQAATSKVRESTSVIALSLVRG